VSSTATVAPLPSSPAFHAAGAPICVVLSSSAAPTLRSSQIRPVVTLRALLAPLFQYAPRASLPAFSATAPMLGRLVPPPVRNALVFDCTISGSVELTASP
jgi:hypothetical protein